MSSSSSDSDSSERVQNVNQQLVKTRGDQQDIDESYAYKKKLGDLIFDAAFEGGNLGFIEKIDEFNYDLMIRPDVANPRYRLWFNFKISNQRPNQCVVFNIVNLSDRLMLFHEGLTPVVRCQRRPDWLRLHEDQVFYYKSVNHGDRFVLSIVFRFDTFDNEHQFALFYPYTLSDLTHIINRWTVELKRRKQVAVNKKSQKSMRKMRSKTPEEQRLPRESSQPARSRSSLDSYEIEDRYEEINLDVQILMRTALANPVYHMRIGRDTAGTCEPRPVVVVACRLGGNLDCLASLVCQAIFDFALSENVVARAARELIDIHVFPMIDPDSIVAGNSKSLILGQSNLTLRLIEANKSVYPNFVLVQNLITKLCSEGNRRAILIHLCVDTNIIGSRIRGNHFNDSLRKERHLSFPRLLSKYAQEFYLENCKFPSKMDDNCRKFDILFDPVSEKHNVDTYKLDVSPFAAYRRSLVNNKYSPLNQVRCKFTGIIVYFFR